MNAMGLAPRVRVSLWAVALAMALLPCATASGRGPLRFTLLGDSFSPAFTDGARWAAYEPSAGTTVIIDSRSKEANSRANPAGCTGGLTALGSGDLLYACRGACGNGTECVNPLTQEVEVSYVVENAATGQYQPVAGETHLPGYPGGEIGSTRLLSVGSQWVEGESNTLYAGANFFLNWHTGSFQWEPEFSAGQALAPSLDTPSPTQPLCAPLTRTFKTGPHEHGIYPFAYAFPLAAEINENNELRLRKCGTRNTRRLPAASSALGDTESDVQLGGGVLSWIAYREGKIVDLDTVRLNSHARDWHGRIRTFVGPRGAPKHRLLQHTATTLYQSVEIRGVRQVYSARIP